MPKGTIDLRSVARAQMRQTPPETVVWRALEHEERIRGPYWFLGPGALALALVIFGIFAQSWFFIVFVALAYAVLLMYAHRPPREIEFRIAPEGFFAGARHYPYSDLKSFWIFETPEYKELSVETTHLLTPYLRIPLGDADPHVVGRAISRYLPEEEHKEFISDHIARSLGF